MKVFAINGSPKKNGNTFLAIDIVLEELRQGGVDVEVLTIGNKVIAGCTGCGVCVKRHDLTCRVNDDITDEIIKKVIEADGILIGSPTYWAGMNGTLKSLLDRIFYISSANGNIFRGKVGASIGVARRTGNLHVAEQIQRYFNYSEMIVPTSSYWNAVHGEKKGELLEDKEGVQILRTLGKNMLHLLNIRRNNEVGYKKEEKVWTNFIR